MIKKITLAFVATCILATNFSKADEGMWLPLFLKSLNEADMQSKGLKAFCRRYIQH